MYCILYTFWFQRWNQPIAVQSWLLQLGELWFLDHLGGSWWVSRCSFTSWVSFFNSGWRVRPLGAPFIPILTRYLRGFGRLGMVMMIKSHKQALQCMSPWNITKTGGLNRHYTPKLVMFQTTPQKKRHEPSHPLFSRGTWKLLFTFPTCTSYYAVGESGPFKSDFPSLKPKNGFRDLRFA